MITKKIREYKIKKYESKIQLNKELNKELNNVYENKLKYYTNITFQKGGGYTFAERSSDYSIINSYYSEQGNACINPIITERRTKDLEFLKSIGNGVNGEAIIVKNTILNLIMAVKIIPLLHEEYDKKDLTVSAFAEVYAMKICNNFIIHGISPHFNMYYAHFLCDGCDYYGIELSNKNVVTKKPIANEELSSIIRKNQAIFTDNGGLRPKIRDVIEYNKLELLNHRPIIIKTPCMYILNELADGDMTNLLSNTLTYNELVVYLFQIYSAIYLCYLHKITHHDLWAKNVLYKNDIIDTSIHDYDQYTFIYGSLTCSVKVPLVGKILLIWDFGRVNIEGVINTTYNREPMFERLKYDVDKIINMADYGIKNIINKLELESSKKEMMNKLIDDIIPNYNSGNKGIEGVLLYLIYNINLINKECTKKRYEYVHKKIE